MKYLIKINRDFLIESDTNYILNTTSMGCIPEYKINIPKDRTELVESTEDYIRLSIDYDILNPYIHTNKVFKGVSDIKLL